jgi:hypothetical protein
VVTAWAARADAGNLGPSAGVDTINADQYEIIRCLFQVTVTGNMVLQAAAEVAAKVLTLKAGSYAIFRRLS